jgi:hypothetical protein
MSEYRIYIFCSGETAKKVCLSVMNENIKYDKREPFISFYLLFLQSKSRIENIADYLHHILVHL